MDPARRQLEDILRAVTVSQSDMSRYDDFVKYVEVKLGNQVDPADDIDRLAAALLFEAALEPGVIGKNSRGELAYPLLAAMHLFALGDYPEDIRAKVPGVELSIHEVANLANVRPRAKEIISGVDPREPGSLGLRSRLAGRAGHYGTDRGVFKKNSPSLHGVAEALWDKMNDLLTQGDILKRLRSRVTTTVTAKLDTRVDLFEAAPVLGSHVARDHLIRTILDHGDYAGGALRLLLYGPPGIGKSTLTVDIAKSLSKKRVIVVRCQTSHQAVDVSEARRGSDMVGAVVIDHAGSVDDVMSIMPQNPAVPVIVSSLYDLRIPGFTSISLPEGFTDEEASALLTGALPDVPPDRRSAIAATVRNHPLSIRLAVGLMELGADAPTLIDALRRKPVQTLFSLDDADAESRGRLRNLYQELNASFPSESDAGIALDTIIHSGCEFLPLDSFGDLPITEFLIGEDPGNIRLYAALIKLVTSGIVTVDPRRSIHSLTLAALNDMRVGSLASWATLFIRRLDERPFVNEAHLLASVEWELSKRVFSGWLGSEQGIATVSIWPHNGTYKRWIVGFETNTDSPRFAIVDSTHIDWAHNETIPVSVLGWVDGRPVQERDNFEKSLIHIDFMRHRILTFVKNRVWDKQFYSDKWKRDGQGLLADGEFEEMELRLIYEEALQEARRLIRFPPYPLPIKRVLNGWR